MAAAGRDDLIGTHGWVIAISAIAGAVALLRAYDAPEPSPARLSEYYDEPSKVGIILTLIWGVIGMLVGVWIAALLAWPELTIDAAWASFGRLRPVHTLVAVQRRGVS